jgi:hypothetical protein
MGSDRQPSQLRPQVARGLITHSIAASATSIGGELPHSAADSAPRHQPIVPNSPTVDTDCSALTDRDRVSKPGVTRGAPAL